MVFLTCSGDLKIPYSLFTDLFPPVTFAAQTDEMHGQILDVRVYSGTRFLKCETSSEFQGGINHENHKHSSLVRHCDYALYTS